MDQTSDDADQLNRASLQEIANETSKKSYHPPRLHDYGHLRDVTMSLPAGPNFDGGGVGGNIYAS